MRRSKTFPINLNYTTLSYLQMMMHQHKSSMRDNPEKRRAYDNSLKEIHEAIGKAYEHFLTQGKKIRIHSWEK